MEATFRVTKHTTLTLGHASHEDVAHVFNVVMHTDTVQVSDTSI